MCGKTNRLAVQVLLVLGFVLQASCQYTCQDKSPRCTKVYCNYPGGLRFCMKTCNICTEDTACSSSPCVNNGTCVNDRYGGFYCICILKDIQEKIAQSLAHLFHFKLAVY